MATVFLCLHLPASSRKTIGGTRGKATHEHTGNIFFFPLNSTGCFQVTVHLHKRSTLGAFRLHFSVLFEARILATTLLDGKQFFCIPVLQGNARWWPSEAGNVADDSDLTDVWGYRDFFFFLRQRHSRWQMAPTTPVKVAALCEHVWMTESKKACTCTYSQTGIWLNPAPPSTPHENTVNYLPKCTSVRTPPWTSLLLAA